MSRSDEEGFHPHPGDPWHPGWDEDGGEDPFASAPEDDASDEEKPRRRRGLFGRRKSRAEEPSAGVPEEFVDDGGLPEPGGWETLDDEMVVADLESIAPESAPSWTDEGGSSVEFESAFTVGGDLSTGEEEAVDPDADADADALDADALAADALPTPEEPTEILDAVALPDLPELAGAGPDDEGISADAGSDDLARAVQEAAAVLGARNGDEAVGIAEDELDAVEVDDLPGAVDDGPAGAGPSDDGVQETLLAAGLDLEETGPPADPGYTPEADDEDGDTPWEAPSAPAPDGEDDDDIVAVEDVDAALAAIASEPVAAADQDALDALRALGDDDEDDQWAAFAEGAPLAPSAASGDLTEPPPPAVPGGDEWLGDEDPEEQAAGDRAAEDQGGFFARRRARRSAGQEDVPPEQDAAWDEAPAAGWGAADEPETGLDADPDAAGAPDDEGPSGWDAAGGPDAGAAAPEAAGDTAAGDEAWDDALATDDEADAFFAGGGDEQDGGFFARRRARKAAEAAAADAVPADGWGAQGEPAAAWGEEPAEPDPAWAPGAVEDAASGHEEPSAGPGSEAPPTAAGPGYGADAADAGVEEPPAGRDRDQDDWDQGDLEQAEAGDALREPGSPVDEQPWEQPVADLPLLDDGDDRIEVMPLGEQPQPPEPVEPIAAPPPAPPVPAAESEVEDEYGEWRGEGGRVPSSWFADIDEDEVDVEDIRPADVEEPAPMLEAGGMFDVDDILDPIDEPVEQAPGSFEASAPRAPETAPGPAAGEPEVVSEPPDVFVPAPGGGEPDLLGAAAALFPEGDGPEEPTLWDATVEMGAATAPTLPGGGAEPWNAPPLVPPDEGWADEDAAPAAAPRVAGPGWGDDAGEPYPAEQDAGEGFTEEPYADEGYGDEGYGGEGYGDEGYAGEPSLPAGAEAPASGEVYDVVEDDLDRAPAHDGPADITEDIYAGSVTMEHRGLAEAIAAAGAEDTELTALSAAMPGLDTGVVGFEDVEDLGTDEIYVPPARSDLGARIVTGIILIALLGASMWTSGGLLAGFIGIMVLIGLTEYFTTLRHKGYTPLVIFGYLGAIGALAGAWAWGPIAIPGAIAATTGIVYFFYAFAPRRRDALANGALTVLGMAWVTGTVAFAMPIAAAPDYRVLVFALVASTVAMDVGAYGFGRAWGSAPMAPVLSPNKSIEGLAGGVVLSIGVAVLVGYLFDPFTIQTGAALGLVVAVTAPLGDLAESMFKRSLGVKDMGAMLPGHGGIMDRVDSFLFVIPPAWVLYEFLGYLS